MNTIVKYDSEWLDTFEGLLTKPKRLSIRQGTRLYCMAAALDPQDRALSDKVIVRLNKDGFKIAASLLAVGGAKQNTRKAQR